MIQRSKEPRNPGQTKTTLKFCKMASPGAPGSTEINAHHLDDVRFGNIQCLRKKGEKFIRHCHPVADQYEDFEFPRGNSKSIQENER